MTKSIVAIIAITILEGLAIIFHLDGALFGLAIAAIAGLGGYEIGILHRKKDNTTPSNESLTRPKQEKPDDPNGR